MKFGPWVGLYNKCVYQLSYYNMGAVTTQIKSTALIYGLTQVTYDTLHLRSNATAVESQFSSVRHIRIHIFYWQKLYTSLFTTGGNLVIHLATISGTRWQARHRPLKYTNILKRSSSIYTQFCSCFIILARTIFCSVCHNWSGHFICDLVLC